MNYIFKHYSLTKNKLMRLKAILIAALMVCGVSTVSAQTEKGLRYGVTAGLNCSNFS